MRFARVRELKSIERTALFSLIVFAVTAGGAMGQDGRPRTPDGYRLLRYEEDYSRLCDNATHKDRDNATHRDTWDPVKCLPLGADRHLSVAGEFRLQYERYDGLRWGAETDDRNGYLLQRFMLHGDVHAGKHARAFLQLKSGLENGRLGGPRPPDKNALDLHQAFLDLTAGENRARFTLRAGRQEIALGNSRLITVREGANVRLSFDGVRASMVVNSVNATVFAVKPVQTRAGVFDDAPEKDRTLMGVHVETPQARSGRAGLDVYLFDHRRTSARFNRGIDREHRYTVGIRVSGRSAAFLYDVDGILQRGSFADARIAAWALAGEAQYVLPISRLHPRLGFRLDAGSGDASRNDPALGTFHPLYPRGPEISEAPLIGAPNLIAVRPFLQVSPRNSLTILAEFSTLWRQSIGDGLYDRSGELLLPNPASPARLVGHELSVLGRWTVDRHTHAPGLGNALLGWPFSRRRHAGTRPWLRDGSPPVQVLGAWREARWLRFGTRRTEGGSSDDDPGSSAFVS